MPLMQKNPNVLDEKGYHRDGAHIHHVTAKQAYQIRAVAERSLTTKKAPKEQAIISGTRLIWDIQWSRSMVK